MRKRVIAFGLLAGVGAGIGVWLTLQRARSPLCLSYVGREPGRSYEAAAFYITNSRAVAIWIPAYSFEVCRKGKWIKDPYIMLSGAEVDGASSTNDDYAAILEPGKDMRVVLPYPSDRPWRLWLDYCAERSGIRGLWGPCSLCVQVSQARLFSPAPVGRTGVGCL